MTYFLISIDNKGQAEIGIYTHDALQTYLNNGGLDPAKVVKALATVNSSQVIQVGQLFILKGDFAPVVMPSTTVVLG